jgi:RecB family exonuclease
MQAQLALDGYEFIGYIDRLDRDDATGAVAVVDYKTGTIAATAAEYRDKVRQFKDFQLPFYYWARTAQGDRVSALSLVPLKDALAEVRPIVLEVVAGNLDLSRSKNAAGVIPIVELERARTRMVQICADLTSGAQSTFRTAEDPSACTYCAYTVSCPGRPYPAQNRFGR